MRDFFETDSINFDEYDHKVSFDLIDKLYEMSLSYRELLNKYNKYQKQISNLTEEEKAEISEDPEFVEIRKKLTAIDLFTRNNAFKDVDLED